MGRIANAIVLAFTLAGVALLLSNCGTNQESPSITQSHATPLNERNQSDFDRQWQLALETLPSALTNSPAILSAPRPRVSSLIFQHTVHDRKLNKEILLAAKQLRIVSSRGGLVLAHVSELEGCLDVDGCMFIKDLFKHSERDEVQLFNGLISTASYEQDDSNDDVTLP